VYDRLKENLSPERVEVNNLNQTNHRPLVQETTHNSGDGFIKTVFLARRVLGRFRFKSVKRGGEACAV
jgi:hypothetical protein